LANMDTAASMSSKLGVGEAGPPLGLLKSGVGRVEILLVGAGDSELDVIETKPLLIGARPQFGAGEVKRLLVGAKFKTGLGYTWQLLVYVEPKANVGKVGPLLIGGRESKSGVGRVEPGLVSVEPRLSVCEVVPLLSQAGECSLGYGWFGLKCLLDGEWRGGPVNCPHVKITLVFSTKWFFVTWVVFIPLASIHVAPKAAGPVVDGVAVTSQVAFPRKCLATQR